MKKKACKKDKIFVEKDVCPICGGNQFTENWKGRLFVFDVNNSEIAKKTGIKLKGEYAIKTR